MTCGIPKVNREELMSSLSSQPAVDFVLITALSEERDALLEKLTGYQQLSPTTDDIRTYFRAELPVIFPDHSTDSYSIVLMCLSGMGRVQAVTATSDAIRRWHPRYIVLVGIAGGVAAQNVQIGDILVSDQIVDYELQKITPSGPQVRWEVQRADARLLTACNNYLAENWQNLIKVKRPARGQIRRHMGPIASGDKVIAFGEVLAKYCDVWPKLVGVEMEAAGVATAAFQSPERPGFFIIRGISDLADLNKDTSNVEKWRLYACDAAASFTVAFLSSGPVPVMDGSDPVHTKQVQIILEGDFNEFTPRRRDDVVNVLAVLLQLKPYDIQILKVDRGSIQIVLEMPDVAADHLYEIAIRQEARLLNLGIKSVLVEGRNTIEFVDRSTTKPSPISSPFFGIFGTISSLPLGEEILKRTGSKVFISYSWDDDNHREWVHNFATRLSNDGISVILDRWYAGPGTQLPEFMERAVRESDFVLCICTPKYKDRFNQRDGGVGYEGDLMVGESLISRNQRKFIPILRRGNWKDASPSWLAGKYYVDLRADPYSEQSYRDLLTAFQYEPEKKPSENSHRNETTAGRSDFEFVNRKIELATLNPAEFWDSYWQCALVSAPPGYGKSRLLERLISSIETNQDLKQKWNYRYIDIASCEDPANVSNYIWEEICREKLMGRYSDNAAREYLCNYVLGKMSVPFDDEPARGVLLIIDSIEELTPSGVEWLSPVLHEVITGSYISYEKNQVSFPVRLILSGTNTASFWTSYKKWEKSSNPRDFLRAPRELALSAFKRVDVEDLVSRRAERKSIAIGQHTVSDISEKLFYLSGGHPAVINGILTELFEIGLRRYDDYLKYNRERLVRSYVTKVAKKILNRFPLPQSQRDIRTICAFRLIDLNTLRKLVAEELVSPQVDINILGLLCENKILNPPSAEMLFYHDDIIRRILYLDLSIRNAEDKEHVQKTHKCAKIHYDELIRVYREQHSFHYFFVEWLFHTLQITDITKDVIVEEWKDLLSFIQLTSVSLDDLKRALWEKLEMDSEIKYLYRERFDSEDFSPLFEFSWRASYD